MPRHLAPLRKWGVAMGACSAQAEQYGQCMLAHYQQIERGVCDAEFAAFRACVQTHLKKRF